MYDARLEELSAFVRWASHLNEDGHPDLRAGLSMSQIAERARAAFRGQRAPDWAYNVAPEPTGEPVPAQLTTEGESRDI